MNLELIAHREHMFRPHLAAMALSVALATSAAAQEHLDPSVQADLVNEIYHDERIAMPEGVLGNEQFESGACKGTFLPDGQNDSGPFSLSRLLYKDTCEIVVRDTTYLRVRIIDVRKDRPRRPIFIWSARIWGGAEGLLGECTVWVNRDFEAGKEPGTEFISQYEDRCGQYAGYHLELIRRFKS